MLQNEAAPEGALPYTFCINGKKTYVKGVNMTPLDHLYGTVTKEQYEYLVAAMVNARVNLVRVWGGGLIEKEEFYDPVSYTHLGFSASGSNSFSGWNQLRKSSGF